MCWKFSIEGWRLFLQLGRRTGINILQSLIKNNILSVNNFARFWSSDPGWFRIDLKYWIRIRTVSTVSASTTLFQLTVIPVGCLIKIEVTKIGSFDEFRLIEVNTHRQPCCRTLRSWSSTRKSWTPPCSLLGITARKGRIILNLHYFFQCCGSESGSVRSVCFQASWIRIHQSEAWIRILLSSSKNSKKKNLDSYCFVTSF